MASQRFVPSQPPRTRDWQPNWRGLTGKRLRSSVWNVPEPAFDVFHHSRRLFGRTYHLLHDPALLGEVLLDREDRFRRPSIARKALEGLLGNSLLLADGEDWRVQRRLVAPAFNPRTIDSMAAAMLDEAMRAANATGLTDSGLDVFNLATRTTIGVIARALFSGDTRLLTAEAFAHVQQLTSQGGQPRLLTLLGLSRFDPSPSAMRGRRSVKFLRDTLGAMIDERGSGGDADFFSQLVSAFRAGHESRVARELATDNAITFYIAGHETVSVLLTWAAYCLAGQPELQEDLRAEALAALQGPPERLPVAVPCLAAFIDEVLRLYPPGVLIAREVMVDTIVGDIAMKRGDIVTIYPWVLHRHRRLWEDPDAFNANRMNESGKAGLQRFQFLPFGAGPRVCVGARFALVEARVVLSFWLSRWRFTLPPEFAPIPSGTIALRPEGGMTLQVERI